jgi:hypothetical protein
MGFYSRAEGCNVFWGRGTNVYAFPLERDDRLVSIKVGLVLSKF